MKMVILETPLAAPTFSENFRNVKYARMCMLDCIRRGEAPFASHLLYPQVLNDADETERELGIRVGLEIGKRADATVVYTDYGISKGMKHGIKAAEEAGRAIEYRTLPR